jgi:cobalamin biosynthesis Mg chelatase CobN
MLDTNLSKAERADITEYDLRVVIDGQPTRNLVVNKLPTTLFNIIPGTRLQAYLTLKGASFGASSEYAGKPYIQGTATSSASPTITTSPKPTATPKPTSSSATPTPGLTQSPSTSATPSTGASAVPSSSTTPVSTSPTNTTGKTASSSNVLSIVKNNPVPIILIAVLTAVLLELVLILYRRRKSNQSDG